MAFGLINSTINGGSSGTSGTVSPGWTLAAGDLVVVGVAVNSATILSNPTVTDSAGNTYTLRAGLANLFANNANGFWFFDSRIATGGPGITITASFSASTLWAVSALEYSFAGGSLGYDATSTGHNDAGSTTVDPGSITLAGSGRLVLSGCSTGGNPTFAAGGGFTLETSLNTSGPAHQAVADLTPASGTADGTISVGGVAVKWAAAQVSYYESAAAARFRRTTYDRAGSRGAA